MFQATGKLSFPDSGVLPKALQGRVLDWLYTLLTHDKNQTQAILRAATALGYGLDPEKYVSQFPGSTVNIMTAPPPAEPAQPASTTTSSPEAAAAPVPVLPAPSVAVGSRPGPGLARTALLATALGAVGVAAGWGLVSVFRPVPVTTSPPANVVPDQQWQLRIVPPGEGKP